MSQASLFTRRPRRTGGGIAKAFDAFLRVCRGIISPITRPLATAAGAHRARQFRQEVLAQMSLTVSNLHPEAVIGGTDRRGWYTEVCLNFRDFRIRVTRAIYNRRHQDFWADIGSTSDPAAFFKMEFVISALSRLDPPNSVPMVSRSPESLAELDATIWALHEQLAEHLSAERYPETRSMIQQVMHE